MSQMRCETRATQPSAIIKERACGQHAACGSGCGCNRVGVTRAKRQEVQALNQPQARKSKECLLQHYDVVFLPFLLVHCQSHPVAPLFKSTKQNKNR